MFLPIGKIRITEQPGWNPLSVGACFRRWWLILYDSRLPGAINKGGVGKKDLSVVSPESSGIKMISNICPETELSDKRNATSGD